MNDMSLVSFFTFLKEAITPIGTALRNLIRHSDRATYDSNFTNAVIKTIIGKVQILRESPLFRINIDEINRKRRPVR